MWCDTPPVNLEPLALLVRWQHCVFNKARDSCHRASLTRDTNQCVCDITTHDCPFLHAKPESGPTPRAQLSSKLKPQCLIQSVSSETRRRGARTRRRRIVTTARRRRRAAERAPRCARTTQVRARCAVKVHPRCKNGSFEIIQ